MKLLGQTKERKTTLTMGLGIVMTKSLKTLRMTTLIERVLRARPEPGGGSNKYTFRKVSQIVFRKDSQVRNACVFASFRKYVFAVILMFRKHSQI